MANQVANNAEEALRQVEDCVDSMRDGGITINEARGALAVEWLSLIIEGDADIYREVGALLVSYALMTREV